MAGKRKAGQRGKDRLTSLERQRQQREGERKAAWRKAHPSATGGPRPTRSRRSLSSDGWCILMTSSGRTLRLSRSLNRAGIVAWTPQTIIERKRPRSSKTIEIDQAIMPGFVFARADRLIDIHAITALPVSPCPPFSIFQEAGRVPVIADDQITAIREEEHKQENIRATKAAEVEMQRQADERHRAAEAAAKTRAEKIAVKRARAETFSAGQSIEIEDGAWAGMKGVILSQQRGRAVIDLGGRSVNIASWLLLPVSVEAASPSEGSAT